MSLSARIDLENRIFARAAVLQVPVHAKYGALYAASNDVELQTAIYVYNVHFRAENYRQYCCGEDALENYRAYQAQRCVSASRTPLLCEADGKFELIMEGKAG